jgi:glycosyltransferase involved in cell wall biosynthesis
MTDKSVGEGFRDQDVFVVIPAYNEGTVLTQTVDELLPYGFQLVIVDDGSAVPATAHLRERPVHYLRHATNLGQGAALQTGMEYALSRGAKAVVHFDADGQHSPLTIRNLLDPIRRGECDVALGSRFIDPKDRDRVPRMKQIVLKAGVCVSWLFAGLWLTDTHNGLRALSAEATRQIKLTENGYAHATEILELIRKAGLRIKEVPTKIRYTEHSLAKGQSIWNSFNILFDLLLRKLVQ